MSKFKVLNDREHILLRPAMYVGSVDSSTKKGYIFTDGQIEEQEIEHVPALEKIINEIIDNSVDEYIRTNGKHANKIDVIVTSDEVTVRDNGRGIPVIIATDDDGSPVVIDGEEQYIPTLAWTKTKAGSNFDDSERVGIGMNGVGSSLTNIFSTEFVGTTFDGSKVLTLTSKDNMESVNVDVQELSLGQPYTQVRFKPDFSRFECETIDDNLIKLLKTRIIKLATVYNITFTINNEIIKPIRPRGFARLFSEDTVFYEGKDWYFFLSNSSEDEFKQMSIINGLEIKDGSHTDLIVGDLTKYVRDKLVKKYKEIKIGDIKSKLLFVSVMRSFPNFKTDSQTKERLSNSVKELKTYFNESNWNKMIEKIGNEILKNKTIIDPIVEIYKIKEEFKKRQELKTSDKIVKRVVDGNYLKTTGTKNNLFLTEGLSAQGGLSAAIGRDGNSYLALKGVPLNVLELMNKENFKKITSNDEQQLIKNVLGYSYVKENSKLSYQNIVIASDADADGMHIMGLLLGNMSSVIPSYLRQGRVKVLRTPIAAVIEGTGKKAKVVQYATSFDDIDSLKCTKKSQKFKYFKGYGSWNKNLLQNLIKDYGLETFLETVEVDDWEIFNKWLSSTEVVYRKESITETTFNINKV